MFNFFKKIKEDKQFLNDINKLALHQKVEKSIEKAKNLVKLRRDEEAKVVLNNAEKLVWDAINDDPKSIDTYMLLIKFFLETNQFDVVTSLAKKILEHKEVVLDKKHQIYLEHLVYRLEHEKPYYQKSNYLTSDKSNYTIIYSCQNCGSIINYITVPCCQCQWCPNDLMSLARSIILSSQYIEVPMLLSISRKIIEGKQPFEVVGNLDDMARHYYSLPEHESGLRQMFELLKVDAEKNSRSMLSLRECYNCGKTILFSNDEECSSCGEDIDWPDMLRLLVCIDNLIWLFERRIEIQNSKHFSEFICLLSVMRHNMLYKQEHPTQKEGEYALVLLSEMKVIKEFDQGGFIITTDIDNMKIYIIKERMTEETQNSMIWLFDELSLFVAQLKHGIQL